MNPSAVIETATKKILLVEDHVDFARIVRYLLETDRDTHFEIKIAPDLQNALLILKEEPFDLILLDLGLPDSSGIDTFDQIHAENKNVPVVILSGMDDEDLALSLVKKGAQDYLVKDAIDEKIFSRILKYALERHAQKKQVDLLNERLEKLSFLDPLTELLNRRGLQRVLSRELSISSREASSLMVILLDLDNFKPINDTFGHAVGDIVLKEIAKVLIHTVRATDYVCRIGGDEFLILLPNTRAVEAVHLSERMRLAINRSPVVLANGKTVRSSASFGVVHVGKRVPSIDELLEETHDALAKSKELGKNRISFGRNGQRIPENTLTMLKKCDQFYALKQPIYDLEKESVAAYEFLSRTRIPGLEMPDEFFGFSHENNILSVVDRMCLEASILASYKVPAKCGKHLNLLPSTIANLQAEHLNRLFPPAALGGVYHIEISEQQILGDPSYLVPIINEFRKRKIRISIDDVGFGRSCLESLIVLHPDSIKIDKKLVIGVSRNKNQKEILQRLLNAVNNLGAKIIAEGIETREDLETVKKMGVRYGQGFFWGKPS